jgi:mRNA-degrading endonuclease RelE of RelBE toxin-antitoxin system
LRKMRTKIITIVFLIGILSVVNAQDNVDKNEMVGFACYFEGSESKTVEKFAKKLKDENYKWISKKLNSDNNAEKYMSVITLEKLSELGKHKLNQTELNLISEIKKSTELVSVCSGCTYFQKVELKNMFTDEMMTMGSYWLNYNLKTD